MTRRKVIYWNNTNNSYIISEEFNGDKKEMQQTGIVSCDRDWEEFVHALDAVRSLLDFLKVISFMTGSYHAVENGEVLPERSNRLPGSRLDFAYSWDELMEKVSGMDEVWEVRQDSPGAHILDVTANQRPDNEI